MLLETMPAWKAGSESEVTSQLDLKAIRWPLKARTGSLIVDDEEITIRAIVITQPDVDDRDAGRRIKLYQRRRKELAREVVVHPGSEQAGGEVSRRQTHSVVTL